MKRVLTTLAAALALAVPALAQVAQIGDTTYADFNSFFTAFQAIAPSETPTTVTLLDDLTGDLAVPGTVPVKEGQTIVFDLNGRTMEAALQREGRHYYAIDNYGTLTIKDSSAGQTGTIRARGVQNLGNGKLTIEGGTIVSVDANGGACVWNEADVTIAGGTFTTEFVGTPSDSFGPGCLNNSGTALVTGGTFLKALNRQDVSRPNAIQVSGGTFSEPLDLTYCVDGFIPTATTVGDTTSYGVKETDAVAVIAKGDGSYTECASLPQAVGFVPANVSTTITVLRDITGCGQTKIEANKNVIIDLNGHDVTFAKSPTGTTASYPCFTVRPTGHLTLTGTGTISESDPIWTPICVNGSGASDAKYACSVTVEENVTLKGWSGIVVDPIAKTIKAAYNVSITLAGKIEADTYGIYVNGGLSNATGPVPEIAVTETADIDSKGDGIYAAGYAKWTLAGQITARTAIVARSGVLTFKGGTYTSIMRDAFEEVAIDHPGGAVGTGAALSVSTADGYGATTIDIQGGTFVSANGPAIYEYAAPTIVGGEAPTSQVTLAISDGTFTADGEYGALLLTAMDNPQVISGGTFSTAVPDAYCAAGYAPKQNADGTYSVVGWYESGVDLDADGVADAWVIRNEGDLAAFRDKVNGNVTFAGCTVTLAANLDLAGVAWIPIGEGNAGGASKNGGFFAGTFEGGNHLIANLSVSESKADEGAGLFGWVRGATIRNLSVSGSILSNANGAAGVIGVVESNYVGNLSTTIENVHNVGDTVRGSKAGGIVGDIRRGGTVAITGCTNAAAVTASINHSDQVDALCAGGIVGNAGGTSVAISGCSNSGAVTATPDEEGWAAETPTYAGGIVGRMGTGTLAAGNGDNTGAVSASGAGTVGQGAILGGMVAGTHPVVELALSQEEAEGGRATLFTGTSLDDASGLEVTPVLPEGMDEPDDFVVTLEDGLFYCDLLYLAERVAGESEGATFDANAQQALLNAAGGSMHGNIAVSGRTGGDKALTTAQVNEALACFEGTGLIVVEGSLEGEKTLVVAYDFGITDVRVTGTGDLVVEVAAQDMSGRPLAFAEGATLSLRNGETALETTPATVEGVTTLTVPAANVPAGNLISNCVSSTHGPREDIVPRGFSYTLCPPKLSPDGTGGADFACGMGGGPKSST